MKDILENLKDKYTELNEQHSRLAHAERLTTTIQQVMQDLYGNEETNIQSGLSKNIAALQDIAEFDEKLNPVIDLLQEALVQIDESISEYVDADRW